jgi:hypothetical protein
MAGFAAPELAHAVRRFVLESKQRNPPTRCREALLDNGFHP